MKITRFVISDYKQFDYLNIDLTYPKGHPNEGQPLEKVCFIGKNGTGKTTILNFIEEVVYHLSIPRGSSYIGIFPSMHALSSFSKNSQFCLEIEFENNIYILGRFMQPLAGGLGQYGDFPLIFKRGTYGKDQEFYEKVFLKKDLNFISNIYVDYRIEMSKGSNQILESIQKELANKSSLIYSPTEYNANQSSNDLYRLGNLNDGITFGKTFPFYHKISYDYLKNFWSLLTYQVNRREQERKDFENKSENLNKTKAELIRIFDEKHPDILKVIADKWNFILETPGLYFDYEGATRPVQLSDNLIAYIKSIRDKNNEIHFYDLSSGIKNLIFNIGYLISLYFHRDIKSAFALFDEPEFSLFPDILLKLIDIYTNPLDFPNTQFFFATHSPILASQFKPEERICLHFDDDRKVTYSRGIAPHGDDPNDILLQDFGMTEIMPDYGLNKWKEYRELKQKIENEKVLTKKQEFLRQFSELRRQYRFPSLYE